jgi:hypothetical protein
MDLTGPRRGGRANELGRRGPAQRCTAGRRGGVSGGGAPGGIKLAVEETRAWARGTENAGYYWYPDYFHRCGSNNRAIIYAFGWDLLLFSSRIRLIVNKQDQQNRLLTGKRSVKQSPIHATPLQHNKRRERRRRRRLPSPTVMSLLMHTDWGGGRTGQGGERGETLNREVPDMNGLSCWPVAGDSRRRWRESWEQLGLHLGEVTRKTTR